MRSLLLFCLVVVACGGSPHDGRLFGAWKSNYELTLAEFRKVPGLTREQLELLSDPELFGHMVQVWGPEKAIVIYEGECSVTPYEVVEKSESYVDVEYYDAFFEERTTRRIFFGDGAISVPAGKAREIFTPVDLDAVRMEHDCLDALLDALR